MLHLKIIEKNFFFKLNVILPKFKGISIWKTWSLIINCYYLQFKIILILFPDLCTQFLCTALHVFFNSFTLFTQKQIDHLGVEVYGKPTLASSYRWGRIMMDILYILHFYMIIYICSPPKLGQKKKSFTFGTIVTILGYLL